MAIEYIRYEIIEAENRLQTEKEAIEADGRVWVPQTGTIYWCPCGILGYTKETASGKIIYLTEKEKAYYDTLPADAVLSWAGICDMPDDEDYDDLETVQAYCYLRVETTKDEIIKVVVIEE